MYLFYWLLPCKDSFFAGQLEFVIFATKETWLLLIFDHLWGNFMLLFKATRKYDFYHNPLFLLKPWLGQMNALMREEITQEPVAVKFFEQHNTLLCCDLILWQIRIRVREINFSIHLLQLNHIVETFLNLVTFISLLYPFEYETIVFNFEIIVYYSLNYLKNIRILPIFVSESGTAHIDYVIWDLSQIISWLF